ncbi:hypothetical protein GCM10023194_30450 [Planotetraspora phitsanulokensis]|uniref:DUF305 domain-containing protein n=1 Tax=Planotetraspora phitsanulokensis TaxID=575192 RepID=A0A8J3U2M3_9ACTN|nr:DUF305 domain-containing protein [Planotetraspora phitsanulokensis]GII35817.1 hypothetical protein Pph01_08200 [Planotetraspora phitsanulokensis]
MRAGTIGAPILAVVTVLLVTRCLAAGPAAHSSHLAAQAQAVQPIPGGAPAPAVASSDSFNATDVAWLQLMIPMTEQAVRLFDLALDKTSNPEIVSLSKTLGAAHRAELEHLHRLLDRSGIPYVNVHEGHNMPGMVTAADLEAINAADGAAFDRLFAQHARDFLRQSVLVAQGEQDQGADADTKAFAATMAEAHAGELTGLEGVGQ